MSLPLGHEHADCTSCPFVSQRDRSFCPSWIPPTWTPGQGLAIVGEGPGEGEAMQKVPFVGASGRLLDRLLKGAGIERAHVALLNATSCIPLKEGKKESMLAEAVGACNPRLFTELEALRPRVIVALGASAMSALTGRFERRTVRRPCSFCGGTGQVMAPIVKRGAVVLGEDGQPQIGPKKCNKTEPREIEEWTAPAWRIGEIAGAVFSASPNATQADFDRGVVGGYDEALRFIIPTYHPAGLLRADPEQSRAGQFLAPVVLAHLRKAKRLLTTEPTFAMEHRTTTDPDELYRFVLEGAAAGSPITLDIETDNKEPWDVTNITCVGFGRFGGGVQHHIGGDLGADFGRFGANGTCPQSLVAVTDKLGPDAPLVQMIATILRTNVEIVTQNGIYDLLCMRLIWGIGPAWELGPEG